MLYTAPDLAFAKIEPHIGELIKLYDDGSVTVSARYDGEDVTIYAEDSVCLIAEMNCKADPEDVSLEVTSAYDAAGLSADVYDDFDDLEEVAEKTDTEKIEDSEAEYDELFEDLLYRILDGDETMLITTDLVTEIKNAVLGILGFKHGLRVYRPANVPSKDGKVVFTCYPYQDYKPDKTKK